VGQRVDECAKRQVRPGWLRELCSAHLVRTTRDGNSANGGEIRLSRQSRRVALGARLSGVVVVGAGRYDLRYRLRDPKESRDFICSMMWFSSSESQICAFPPSLKMPFALITGWTTMALNRPAGTEMTSRRKTRIRTGLRSLRK